MSPPIKYKPEFCEMVNKLAKLGATDAEMADVFGIVPSTFYLWQKEYPEFGKSVQAGKVIADAEVAEKLYQRATGYEHAEDDIRAVNGEIVITPTVKHYPPDTTAGIFWLKNRRRLKKTPDEPLVWCDRQEVTGEGGGPIETKDVSMLEVARRLAFVFASGLQEKEK